MFDGPELGDAFQASEIGLSRCCGESGRFLPFFSSGRGAFLDFMEHTEGNGTNTELILWRRSTVEARAGIRRSMIYQLMATGSFPKPVRLGPKAVAWVASEVLEWISARVAESRSAEGAAVAQTASAEGRRRVAIKKARASGASPFGVGTRS